MELTGTCKAYRLIICGDDKALDRPLPTETVNNCPAIHFSLSLSQIRWNCGYVCRRTRVRKHPEQHALWLPCVQNQRLEDAWLAEPDLTFKKAFEIAQSLEAAEKGAQNIQELHFSNLHFPIHIQIIGRTPQKPATGAVEARQWFVNIIRCRVPQL